MALGRLEVKAGSKGKAQPHFNYIFGLQKFDYKRKKLSLPKAETYPSGQKITQNIFGKCRTSANAKTAQLIESIKFLYLES